MNAHPLGQPLARGRTANVYAWETGYVLKLFHDGVDRASVESEAHIARAVHASGLPVPAVGDIIRINGHAGLIYERVEGPSMLDLLQRKPWRIFAYARRLAHLQVQTHTAQVQADLPIQREKLESKIRWAAALPAHAQTVALAALASMPEGAQLCHGDLHPANILMTAQGDVIIDWMDASRGNPLADVARTTIIILGEAQSHQLPHPLMRMLARVFHQAYLRAYVRLRSQERSDAMLWEEYSYWLPIVASARLSENIPELEEWLIAQALRCKPMPRRLSSV
jgi:Ser/Thr protein kinase RdoA (MazF antagonist)